MNKVSEISQKKLLHINDMDNTTYYGGSQIWYRTRRQRWSGCGPTSCANLVIYKEKLNNPNTYTTKDEVLAFMEEMWSYVTPGLRGINTPQLLVDKFNKYQIAKNTDYTCKIFDINQKTNNNSDEEKNAISFIKGALEKDCPVAFLNLSAEGAGNLDNWHWVLIVDITIVGESVFSTIYDEGKKKEINLLNWLRQTRKGGGFVYLEG